MENPIVKLTTSLTPDFSSIKKDVDEFIYANKDKPTTEIAEKYGDSICWKYASVGAVSALPGVIPGLGTAAQLSVEAGSVSADLMLMLRWMGSMTYGIGYIYGRDLSTNFNQEYVKILGLWCGVLKSAETATKRIGTKVAIAQFNKIPVEIFKKINQRVGTTIVTKYGTKRGGVALGKLIPFGIGAIVGGGFNLTTMKAFKNNSIKYFQTDNSQLIMKK